MAEPMNSGGDSETALNVAAWHLQMLLTSVSSFDSKIMFLTALNVAGMSALIGVAIASSPSVVLLTVGFVLSGACTALGLGVLWSRSLQQFPGPEQIEDIAREFDGDSAELAWRHFAAIKVAAQQAQDALRVRIQVTRAMLLMTPLALGVVVTTALTSAA